MVNMLNKKVLIIGGGLAGSEAAWQLARRGIEVELYEMRPQKQTPAHHTPYLAELVCSNSFRSKNPEKAAGLLKEEMKLLDSLIIKVAEECQVPAGQALAVDRELFSRKITEIIENHPKMKVIREETKKLPKQRPLILATGPLTSDNLAEELFKITGRKGLYFYDAASPIIRRESIDMNKAFEANRYDKGEGKYINCPLTMEEYEIFWKELVKAERVKPKEFEQEIYFSACQPIEEVARTGKQALLFGCLKPVGLIDPRTGKQPYAVVQLRADNVQGNLYSLVGFQTSLKWTEQERVFSLIPALKKAEFVRFGVMHRNTYLNSPALINSTLEFRDFPGMFIAGQLSGVEGYIESAATGIVAGLNAFKYIKREKRIELPLTTALGSLLNYIARADLKNFQPMHVSFGLLPPLDKKIPKKERGRAYYQRSIEDLKAFISKYQEFNL